MGCVVGTRELMRRECAASWCRRPREGYRWVVISIMIMRVMMVMLMQVAQSSDGTCYNNLQSSQSGHRTLKLDKVWRYFRYIYRPRYLYCL